MMFLSRYSKVFLIDQNKGFTKENIRPEWKDDK